MRKIYKKKEVEEVKDKERETCVCDSRMEKGSVGGWKWKESKERSKNGGVKRKMKGKLSPSLNPSWMSE